LICPSRALELPGCNYCGWWTSCAPDGGLLGPPGPPLFGPRTSASLGGPLRPPRSNKNTNARASPNCLLLLPLVSGCPSGPYVGPWSSFRLFPALGTQFFDPSASNSSVTRIEKSNLGCAGKKNSPMNRPRIPGLFFWNAAPRNLPRVALCCWGRLLLSVPPPGPSAPKSWKASFAAHQNRGWFEERAVNYF